MPLHEIPADHFPKHTRCSDCCYWVPVTELIDGQCEDCFIRTEFEEVN